MTTRTREYYHARLSPARGTAISLAVFCAFVTAGGVVATPLAGLAAAELTSASAVVLAVIVMLGQRDWRDGLFLHRAQPRAWLAASLLGLSMWLVNRRITMFIAQHVALPTDHPALDAVVLAPPLVTALVCVAVLPAVCEELWFRGFWLRNCVSRWPRLVAVVFVSVGFSAFHVSWAQASATLVLGILLGLLTLQSKSVGPAMWAHMLNNTMVILASRHELPWISNSVANHPTLSTGIACGVALCGIVLMAWPRSAANA
ncbi:MAG: CPBP family intramembrane metalloprotease [Kofleriaceae bacterium]|nr:CPBP family intramembrane metalloprotease [Kofleriaceae bacterium]